MMKNVIEIKNVRFHYKGAEESLQEVSLSIKEGETLLLCGASGSGKTSVLRLINGLIPNYYQGELTGEVLAAGKDISKTPLYNLAGVVGTVFQNPRSQFFSVDTDGEIVFGPENVGLEPEEIKRRKELIVNEMGIEKLMGRSLFELSGGEKQQIACASVAALLPGIILLDEPSSNLDRDAIEKLHDIILEWKKQGKTIIISVVMQDVNHQLFTDSVESEVLLSMSDKDEIRCHEILKNLGLIEYKDTHPMALSGGQKQRVAIASAIAAGAELLLFDEPTSGLDFDHMMKVGQLLKELAQSGKTVLVSTHDPELIEKCCDYELYIKNGRIESFGGIAEKIAV